MKRIILLNTLFICSGLRAMDSQQRMLVAAGGAGIVASGYYAANSIGSMAIDAYKIDCQSSIPLEYTKTRLLKRAFVTGLVRWSAFVGGITLVNYGILGKQISPNAQTYSSLAAFIMSGNCFELAAAQQWLSGEEGAQGRAAQNSEAAIKKFLIAGGTFALLGAVGIYKNK